MARRKPATVPVAEKVFVVRTGDVCEVVFTQGMTLGQAIENAGYRHDAVTDVRVNNEKVADMATVLKADDQVMLLGKIAGA